MDAPNSNHNRAPGHRIWSAFLIGTICWWGWHLPWAHTHARPPADRFAPQAITVRGEQSWVRVPPSSRRQVLIVGSLGSSSQQHRVTLQHHADGLLPTDVDASRTVELTPDQGSNHQAANARLITVNSVERSESEMSLLRNGQPEAAVRQVGFQQPEPEKQSRSFFLHDGRGELDDPHSYGVVEATRIASGRVISVYLDRQADAADLADGLTQQIIKDLEQRLLPEMRTTLGRVTDIDGDGQLAVLLTPWLERLASGETPVRGFVRISDFHPSIPAPFGNSCDLVYLNSRVQPGPELTTLLAHEITHAICVSERAALPAGGAFGEEDWLHEALAHMSEDVFGGGNWSNLDHRVACFLRQPATSPLVVRDYYRAGLWRDPGCRGATYLFLRWCVDRYGIDLLSALARSPLHGRQNLERATGCRFEELFRRFSVGLTQPSGSPFAFRSLNLREKLGDYRLNGVHRRSWDPSSGELQLRLRGTTVEFVDIPTASTTVWLRVQADPGTRLQLTLVELLE